LTSTRTKRHERQQTDTVRYREHNAVSVSRVVIIACQRQYESPVVAYESVVALRGDRCQVFRDAAPVVHTDQRYMTIRECTRRENQPVSRHRFTRQKQKTVIYLQDKFGCFEKCIFTWSVCEIIATTLCSFLSRKIPYTKYGVKTV